MVVLAASITSKSGKALVSRQFLDMPRSKIEGYLAAFPRLVETGKQHTYIETENVRYIYQRIEALYLVLITNKQSNVLEDLETLRLLSKLVREYSPSLDEEGISQTAFELIFAFDEAISFGHKENVTVAQVKLYCDMESQEEKLHRKLTEIKMNEAKDIMKRKIIDINKRKIEENRRNKGGLRPLTGSRRSENNTSVSIGSGFGSGSGFGMTSDADPISSRSKGPSPASATTPPKVLGMQLGKSRRVNQLLESLIAEGEVMPEDVLKTSQTRVPLPPIDPVTVTVEERLNVVIKRDGGVSTFDIQGTLSHKTLNQEDGFIQFQIENSEIPGLNFLTHPQINKELFKSERIIGMKDPSRPFPTGQNDVGIMKWRIQGMDEGSLPLTVNCWPSVSGTETSVNIEYEASDKFDLCNVAISVPLPAVREPPSVRQIDGEWRYDPKSSRLEWSILLIDDSNRSGSMEFVVPSSDSSAFFPITVKFTATGTFSDVKVTSVKPLRGEAPLKFSQTIQLIVDNYQVV